MPKVRDIIAEVEADGWVFQKAVGSHRQFKHPTKPGKVTVPGKPGDQLSQQRYYDILRQAGLRGRH
ncbi:MAG TPA: type II toxin-antitoxin system HicA family toxin [Chloroflexota bacterium]|nr:type II toxin-antitoxin system HicA family toxin [Chloroflexota bacterium]